MPITSRNNDSRLTLLRRHTARRRNAGLVTHGNEEVLAEALTITVRAQALTNTTSSAFLSQGGERPRAQRPRALYWQWGRRRGGDAERDTKLSAVASSGARRAREDQQKWLGGRRKVMAGDRRST